MDAKFWTSFELQNSTAEPDQVNHPRNEKCRLFQFNSVSEFPQTISDNGIKLYGAETTIPLYSNISAIFSSILNDLSCHGSSSEPFG